MTDRATNEQDPEHPDQDLPLGMRDGDRGIYKICANPECPANRPGTNHAHFDRVERDLPQGQP